MNFNRKHVEILAARFLEFPQTITIVAGPRQVGKTTLARSAIARHAHMYVSVDAVDEKRSPDFDKGTSETSEVQDYVRDESWLIRTWEKARGKFQAFIEKEPDRPFVFVIDEIQKIPRWSEVVKGLWDADRADGLGMHVVLLGSSPLLVQKGLGESLAGRYELIPVGHWSFLEMHRAFDFTSDEYIYFGGYPGSANLIHQEERWRNYVLNSLIQPNIDTDILLMTRVDKPALLKQAFELGASYSGQILAWKKMKGQLENAGNETTLADYVNLLDNAGMLRGLHKYHVGSARIRASSPKFNVLNTALMSSVTPYTFEQAKADRTYWGRLVESAVGAHLCNTATSNEKVFYWRESPNEVDFVISNAVTQVALEVKSGAARDKGIGLAAFRKKFAHSKTQVVGTGGIELSEFLSYPLSHWLNQ